VLRSISKPLALFWRSRSALSASAARFLAALSALILAWSAVGGLMISVIRIKYLSVSGNHLLVRAVLLLLVSGLEVERRFPLPYAVDIDPNGQ
jgi:hypothetical protein